MPHHLSPLMVWSMARSLKGERPSGPRARRVHCPAGRTLRPKDRYGSVCPPNDLSPPVSSASRDAFPERPRPLGAKHGLTAPRGTCRACIPPARTVRSAQRRSSAAAFESVRWSCGAARAGPCAAIIRSCCHICAGTHRMPFPPAHWVSSCTACRAAGYRPAA
jgi:hypothetical protein